MFFFCRSASKTPRVSHWHDPSAVPSAPILVARPAAAPSTARVHWWNADTTRVTSDAISTFSPWHRLPVCGFFEPSASFCSAQSDDIPWVTLTGPNDNDVSELPSVVIARPVRKDGFRRPAPLKRVLTINRGVGEAIRKKRSIEKLISPADLLRGLGMALSSRPPASKQERKRSFNKVEAWLAAVNETQNFEEDNY